jgi:hypothetical protein
MRGWAMSRSGAANDPAPHPSPLPAKRGEGDHPFAFGSTWPPNPLRIAEMIFSA